MSNENHQSKELDKELESTFPASDPPAATQPGSGITGPEVAPTPGIQSSDADAVPAVDFSSVRDDVAKLAQTLSDLLQKQASSTRDQVVDAVGTAANNVAQSTSDAQDKLTSLEADISLRIRRNPWTAVAIAALVGLLIAKLS
jgi:ElaB/YqjD/DUF883 family membrane-anchored ribosome-binding protein